MLTASQSGGFLQRFRWAWKGICFLMMSKVLGRLVVVQGRKRGRGDLGFSGFLPREKKMQYVSL